MEIQNDYYESLLDDPQPTQEEPVVEEPTVEDTESHIDGSMHTELLMFTEVKDLNSIINNKDLKYFALENDLTIDDTLDLATGSVICLNGHKLLVDKGVKLLELTDGKDITFTDCKNGGAITHTGNTAAVIEDIALCIVDRIVEDELLRTDVIFLSEDVNAALVAFIPDVTADCIPVMAEFMEDCISAADAVV